MDIWQTTPPPSMSTWMDAPKIDNFLGIGPGAGRAQLQVLPR